MSKEFYKVNVKCRNCGYTYLEEVEKGCTIFDWLYNKKCKHCGCATLGHDWPYDDIE